MKKIISLFLLLVILGINISFVSCPSNPDKIPDNYFYIPQNYSLEKCDLNKDGYVDIVIVNFRNVNVPNLDSYIYWGSPTGYSSANRTGLPTNVAIGVVVADLNKDGWPDIVFANECKPIDPSYYSYIYWGSSNGYSVSNRTELPANAPKGVAVSDLNKDGWIDIVFSSTYMDDINASNSYIYWGSPSGYSVSNRAALDTKFAYGISVSDLNKDSWPDLIFGTYADEYISYVSDSYIYWGSPGGFSNSNLTKLPTMGANGIDVNDLNKDGYPDIIFANFTNGSSNSLNSFIYWGSVTGYSTSNRKELPTKHARSAISADLNKDNYIDLVLSSYVYWGSSNGYSTGNRSEFPDALSAGGSICDLNNDTYFDLMFSSPYYGSTYIYWGSSSGYSSSNKTTLPTGGICVTSVMLSYNGQNPPNPSEEELRPKLEALMKHVKGRMHNLERLLAEIEAKLPAEIPDEIRDKLNQVEELLKDAENSKSPSEANKLLNEVKDILDNILSEI